MYSAIKALRLFLFRSFFLFPSPSLCKLWLVWYVVAIDALFYLSWLLVVVVIGVVVVASLIVGIAAVVVILCGECYVIVFLLRP